jgi:cobalt-zinc-cadmium efflux system membrane fusion protein
VPRLNAVLKLRNRIAPGAAGALARCIGALRPALFRNRESPARITARIGVGALAALAIIGVVVALPARTQEKKGGDAPAPAPAAAPGAAPSFKPTQQQLAGLKFATVAKVNFQTEEITDGKIALNGDRTTPVFSPYSGRVTRVFVSMGDVVKAGQPLLALQASEFVQGQSDLLSAQAAAASAHAQLSLAQGTEKRKHALFDARAGSRQDWEQSQSDLAAAQGAAQAADAALAAVRNRLAILGKSNSEIDAIGQAQAVHAEATIVAPIDGTVTDREVGPGQFLQAGAAPPPFTVGDLSTVWLIANVRESDAPFIHAGQTVKVRVNALPDRELSARIVHVAASLDPATRRLQVRAEIPNADGMLKPEMFASFRILSGTAASAPAVPESGVLYEGAEARVWVLGNDGTLVLRNIRPGRSAHGQIEVLEGVAPGDKVVSSGALFIDRAAQGD